MVLADILLPFVENKFFCELGTRRGDHHACLRPHVRDSQAFEVLPEYCDNLKLRKIPTICGDVRAVSPPVLKPCEVFFWWPQRARDTFDFFKLLVNRAKLTSGSVLIGFDGQHDDDMWNMQQQLKVFQPNLVYTVPFFEGLEKRESGTFFVAVFDLRRMTGLNFRTLNYLNPIPYSYEKRMRLDMKKKKRIDKSIGSAI